VNRSVSRKILGCLQKLKQSVMKQSLEIGLHTLCVLLSLSEVLDLLNLWESE
jgi:hypothetical protein